MNISSLIEALLNLEKLAPAAEVLIEHEFGLSAVSDVFIVAEDGNIRITSE